jgi:hypothetical protein
MAVTQRLILRGAFSRRGSLRENYEPIVKLSKSVALRKSVSVYKLRVLIMTFDRFERKIYHAPKAIRRW